MNTAFSRASTGGLRAVLEALIAPHETALVLAIVVATTGPTYRKPGALALFNSDGLLAGALSGGCLEAELIIAAREVVSSGTARLQSIDTATMEDMMFGSGSGCGGCMKILLLPLSDTAALTAALLALGEGTQDLLLAFTEQGAGRAFLGSSTWRWNAAGQTCSEIVTPAWQVCVKPSPRILLLGAGPETPALIAFLLQLGWYIDIQEHRTQWIKYTYGADILLEQRPGLLPATEDYSAVLVMTHHFESDRLYLHALAEKNIPYIGLLGPALRRNALLKLAELSEPAYARLMERLHAPVGLPLGGEGPENIALAISAELTAFLSKR